MGQVHEPAGVFKIMWVAVYGIFYLKIY
jgi:hypothetical protein